MHGLGGYFAVQTVSEETLSRLLRFSDGRPQRTWQVVASGLGLPV